MTRAVLACWVQREATVKAVGGSVWRQFGSVAAGAPAVGDSDELRGEDGAAPLDVHMLDCGPAFIGALAVEADRPLRLRELDRRGPLPAAGWVAGRAVLTPA
ncbi:MAG TPA: hypothetical protein VMM17_04055 [Gemmatimonadaceae bacterium]|nr:hypothetical protein [Gemmatimonadaceae bacterium]